MEKVGRTKMIIPLNLTSWCSPPAPADFNETRQVVFIKVHKAASSTVQNILLRFAMARNLSALLPRQGPIISQHKPVFSRADVVPHPEGKASFDILCSHVIYDKEQLSIYFPETAPRVAILREPLRQTISALVYYAIKFPSSALMAGVAKHPADPINGFLEYPEDFCPAEGQASATHSFINNRMSIDLGLSPREIQFSIRNQTIAENFIRKLEKELDLVLISDYFDESMVLLRRHLHWPMKDIMYLKVNTSPQIQNTSVWNSTPKLNSTINATFHQWAFYDYAIYNHFLTIFLRKIESECLFYEEVGVYKLMQNDVVKYCRNATHQASLQVPAGKWNEAFSVSAADCTLMSTGENNMIDTARKRQLERRRMYYLKMLRHSQTRQQLPFYINRKPNPWIKAHR
ncbi:galactose-3-O-sulfotransferase 3 [Elysia marginata]|uniref:Galactose-3-O-sulfotransferase 3 n=1 Tax=Elysia marginata TaxID=1093978 RepID=A0AAV4EIZ7_9GAST|nr:galactose-3-O-sulfotransferase 3 [Elysia marginata]